jgi:hypothetical protein
MKMIVLILVLTGVISAQGFITASGQTVPFTLQAGARAGWDTSAIAIERVTVNPVLPLVFTAFYNGLINYKVTDPVVVNNARVSLYNIAGRLIQREAVTRMQGTFALNHPLANGIYFVRLETALKIPAKTVKIAVVR